MYSLIDLLSGCKDIVSDIDNIECKEKIELGIEKTLNDSQNNEIQDYGEYGNYFSDVYLNRKSVNIRTRNRLCKDIATRIIAFFNDEKYVVKFTLYTSLKSISDDSPKYRQFKMYEIVDEISINIISMCVYRYYENLISYSSYANKLADEDSKFFYKPYMQSYNAFTSNKYKLMKSHGYNRLLITDIVEYYDRVNEKVLVDIFKKYLPFDEDDTEIELFEKYFDFITLNCQEGLPQGPIFSHFLGALLLYDLPKEFSIKFPQYHIDIYVDDLQIFYYSNGENTDDKSILDFIEEYLSFRLKGAEIERTSNDGYVFISKDKTSHINLKAYDSRYLVLSQELSAINLIKSDFRNLEENDKEHLKELLDSNLKELQDLISNDIQKSDELGSAYKKQKRYTKYRKLLMINNESELIKTIRDLQNDEDVGLFDKSFSNYINAIKANFLYFGKSSQEFEDILDREVITKLISFTQLDEYENIKQYYNKVCSYFVKEYHQSCVRYRESLEAEIICSELSLSLIYKAVSNLRDVVVKTVEVEDENIYFNKEIEFKCNSEEISLDLKESSEIYGRISNLSLQLRRIFERLFHMNNFTNNKVVLPFSNKNRPFKLAEYRILQYLQTATDNILGKIDYILLILDEHIADREFELVDPEALEVIKVAIRSKCIGKYLDNIIVAHHFVRDIWKNGAQDMPFYTLHNQEHSIELIRILSKIDERLNGRLFSRMNMIEKYTLFMSIYVHDLGMLFFSSEDLMQGNKCPQSQKIEMLIQKQFKQIQKNGMHFTRGKIIRGALDFHKQVSFYRTEKTRSEHSYNSRRFSEEFKFIIPELKQVVLEIANNHYSDIKKMYVQDTWFEMSKIDVRYLSILLRVADSLDQSINRVSNTLYTYFEKYVEEMDSTSISHWAKHMLVKNILFERRDKSDDKLRQEYDVIIQFNSLPFTKSFGNDARIVLHDRNEKYLEFNPDGRKTKNLLDAFFDHFFRYVFSEIHYLNEYLVDESKVKLFIKYDDLNRLDKRFLKYEKQISEYLSNV